MDDTTKKEVMKLIDERMAQADSFTARKVTDTPTDSFALVSRKFVTLNGPVASRPVSSVAVIGQSYFATDTNIPMRFDGNKWRNGVGSIVAQNL